MRRPHPLCLALMLPFSSAPVRADVRLPAVIGDHMVLQRNAKVPFWGWAEPNEVVAVTVGTAKATATAGLDGKWSTTVAGLSASDQPIDVTVTGRNTLTLHDVLVGDVWVCSGQSNMEFPLSNAHDAKEEVPNADHPTMRLFVVAHKIAFEPQADTAGHWELCSPRSAAPFSAVGYFFARDVMQDQHVPVGMIGTYWGGTPAQSWIGVESLKAVPLLRGLGSSAEQTKENLPELRRTFEARTLPQWKAADDAWHADNTRYQSALTSWAADVAHARAQGAPPPPKPSPVKAEPRKPVAPDQNPYAPTVLSNGMVAPIVPYAIRGAIWYQGESNAGMPRQYQVMFPALISDWRRRWGEGDFPFVWVQLANYQARAAAPTQAADGWPGLREAQAETLSLPNTGQAVTIDIGQWDSIHPKDKLDVGHRLALAARHVAYGEDIVYSGPTYDSMRVDGGTIQVKFRNVGTGLTLAAAPSTQPGVPPAPAAGALRGFAIAGGDHRFVWATATIEPPTVPGQVADTVRVSSPDVSKPAAVRYGWANNPDVNLYNKEGLPTASFRTDDWSGAAPIRPADAQGAKTDSESTRVGSG